MADETTARRKDVHLDLVANEQVEPPANRTLLDGVHLVHWALPELSLADVDLSTTLFGRKLKLPLMATGMTGGTERAAAVNRDLASAAQAQGFALGLGSQRAMLKDPSRAPTYQLRAQAPDALIIGNIGAWQAVELGVDGVRGLVEAIGADGVALHLNAAQELTQPEGDRDFRRALTTIGELARAMGDRLLVKETGCGISPAVARQLFDAGVKVLDISGLGGTSWIKVEQLRAKGPAEEIGETFSGWGIPTAAAIASVRRALGDAPTLIASGGLRNGLDVAKAMALGADLGGLALPLFRAQQASGAEGVSHAIEVIAAELKQALLLTGSRTVVDLKQRPKVITGPLNDWLRAL